MKGKKVLIAWEHFVEANDVQVMHPTNNDSNP